ncbi:hypothetical protein [Candidatus Parabeggiatoa sp. HSG14]|uniref:hypothetical protein n=1 Tax=Candidatus Parabeggiatoa sp. HSG14 TaxID=3055593 RepID=UPI0025A8389F|nr:hypothetical protein [Thiotrichales bacterium HSG14]
MTKDNKNLFRGVGGLLLYLISLSIWATPLLPKDVPLPLQPWVNWVLHNNQNCFFDYSKTTQHCHWPSRLILNVDTMQATFSQQWQVDNADWITLPGNAKYWPQQVEINNEAALVADRNGVPGVFAPKGQLTIQGQFRWEQRPEFLQIPKNTALVTLSIDGTAVTIPHLDNQGRLWLRQRGISSHGGTENRLDMRVYRRIIDDIPLQLVTRLELDVAGRHREVVLGPIMLDKHQAMSLNSPLPTKLETDGSLRLQVRPGLWTLTLHTRQEGLTNQLTLKPSEGQWVNEEVWVFDARNDLRLVEVQGVTAIDPQQTALPAEWRKFPAYQVQAGNTLELIEKRRGDPKPVPDQLNLTRNFWLDFDGKGYSVQDRITGTMTRGWRLEMDKPAVLGRVAVNGQDQFITRLAEESNTGVEVRRGQIDLVADSRLEKAVTELPAVGWAHDFQEVNAVLHLPPGWRLLNAKGMDNVDDTWFEQWNLMNLFIVLIMAVAIGKLWHWGWGILTLVTMVFIFHETKAPYWVWLNIIASIALLRVLPEMSWFSRFVRSYRNLSLIALLIIALPFMMQQMRQSIYPQLERPWERLDTMVPNPITTSITTSGEYDKYVEMDVEKQAQQIMPQQIMDDNVSSFSLGSRYYESSKSSKFAKRKKLLQIDPNAQVQTGPGLPQWKWESISMRWSGPVQQNQSINLWLLSPTINSALGVARVLLLALLTAFLLWVSWGPGARRLLKKTTFQEVNSPLKSATVAVLLLAGLMVSLPSYAETSMNSVSNLLNNSKVSNTLDLLGKAGVPGASLGSTLLAEDIGMGINTFPPQALLDELQKRLLTPPDCLPHCASSPRLLLELDAKKLSARMDIHILTSTAIPLPGMAKQWLPQQVLLNGESAQGILRNRQGQLWLRVEKGIHQVQFSGPLPNRNTVQLPLPLKSHFVEIKADGWRIDGLHENGIADAQLQFTREQKDKNHLADLEMGTLPPFVQIERTLLLGLDWQIETRVTRQTPRGSAVVLEIPLLEGESVTSEKIRVEGGKALINLSPHQSKISWISVFDKQETIKLIAPNNTFSTEIWRLDASAIWHVEIEGISVVHHQAKGRWLPEWRPWPGESVTLRLTRPEGVLGQVLTIDRSRLIVKPGQRTTDNQLLLNFRSSRGIQHKLTLPENAVLQSVTINGKSQPIRQEGRFVTLPITPGSQQVELNFQQQVGINQHFSTPEVDLGIDSVNTSIEVNMPSNRWILFAGGKAIGPAVMIWGILIVIVLLSVGLGQISLTPLKTHHWLLLGIVLSQVHVVLMLFVVAWFMALGWRAQMSPNMSALNFNATQIALGILTIIALSALLAAIHKGLLGHPSMHIGGNGSSAYWLRWYEDRTAGTLPQVWVFSWSIWIYRIAMLLWALWLSFALLRWLRWGWECFSTDTLWKTWWTKKAVKT